jgi:hypothetical protein
MKSLSEDEYEKVEKEVMMLTEVEKMYFRYLTVKYCSIRGKSLSEYGIMKILGHDQTTTMTIIRDLDNKFEEVMELIEKVKDHVNWEINEAYYIEQEKKEEARMNEFEQEMTKIENSLKALAKIELLYFRDLLMNEYPIYAMGYDIGTIMHTIDGVGATFEEVNKLLENITDHTQWKIPESEYIRDIENGILEDE